MIEVKCKRSTAIDIIKYWHELNDYTTRYVSLKDTIKVITKFNNSGKQGYEAGKKLSEAFSMLANTCKDVSNKVNEFSNTTELLKELSNAKK